MGLRQTAIKACQLLLLCLCGCAAAGGPPAPAAPAPIAAADQAELNTLSDMLCAADSSPKTRYQAATLLLAKSHPRAGEILLQALADRFRRPAGVAVALAVAQSGQCRAEFVVPLFAMIGDPDAAVCQSAAAALSQSRDAAVRKKLCDMAGDNSLSNVPRLACIAAMGRMLDTPSIETMVTLLDDPSADIRMGSADSLSRLTGIRGLAGDSTAWRAWWKENEGKPHEQWLADMAEGLSHQNAQLQGELLAVRRRLADATRLCHESTPAPKRGEMVLAMLQDPLVEVRLLGLELATRQLAAREPLAPGAGEAVRTLVDDGEPSVRAAAAMLMAGLQLPGTDAVLLGRLKLEPAADVRIALIKSLAAMRVGEAFDPILAELAGPGDSQAAAAAAAIGKLAEAGALSDSQVARAAEVISRRYKQAQETETVRTALLAVMRILGRSEFAPVIREALSDKAPAVRLEAVRALGVIRAATAEDVAPLTQDPDRGVRQAAMETLAVLGDTRSISVVLDRTLAAEADPAVRQKAWETLVSLLDKADTEKVAAVAKGLADRPEAREYRIRVLTLLVDRYKNDPAARAGTQAELGELLLAADQPARAAEALAAAYPAAADGRRGRLWLMWVEALLWADDPSALTQMSEQRDGELFTAAVERLCQRLEVLRAAERYPAAVVLADQALARLGDRLAATSREGITAWRADCDRRGHEADAARVAGLLKALNSPDTTAGDQARRELLAMGKRATLPMVEQFRSSIGDEAARGQMEKNVPALLSVIDSRFTGYDPAAPLDERTRVVEAWLQKAQP